MSHATHPVAWTAAAVLLVQVALHLTNSLTPTHARVIISEIMYRPGSGEPEWIELTNTADTSVSIDGWVLHDRTSARPTISSGTIPPHGRAVITGDTTALRSFRKISSLLLQVPLPSLNNTGDDITLSDMSGRIVDSVPYRSSWGGDNGVSLERIDLLGESTGRGNWGSSIDSTGGTPGGKNSIAPAGRDLGVGEPRYESDRDIIVVPVINHGADRSVGATLTLFHDLNRNGAGEVHESISSRSIAPLNPGDSIVAELPWPRPLTTAGERALLVIDHPDDELPEDNVRGITLRLPFGDTGLIINEFMYDPEGDEPEWVEIINRSPSPVDLNGWVLHDAGKSRPILSGGVVPPGDFLVVTSDSSGLRGIRPEIPAPVVEASLPSLNNGGDIIVLRRPDGVAIDSLEYRTSWGGADGRSLERRGEDLPSSSASSWGTSRDPSGATPGRPNALLPPEWNLALLGATFNPEGSTIQVLLESTGRNRPTDARLVAGRDLDGNHRIDQEEAVTSSAIAEETGEQSIHLDWPRPLLPAGEECLLQIVWEADQQPEDDTLSLFLRLPSADSGVIISEFSWDPPDGKPEWVEIYNVTDDSVDLDGWRIADGSGESSPFEPVWLPGRSWLVITSDSASMIDQFGTIDRILRIATLPGLNNGGDIIRLINRDDLTLDSLSYSPSWGEPGKSIERKRVEESSTDRQNWTPSSDPLGGTPGRENSWHPVLIDLVVSELTFSAGGPSPLISGLVFNRGIEEVNHSLLPDSCRLSLTVDLNRDGVVDTGEELSGKLIRFPRFADSVYFALPWDRSLTLDGEWGIVVVEVEGEENQKDNRRTFLVVRPPLDSGLVINEIMYDPVGDEPEWIEIANRSADTIDLEGWILHDAGAARPRLPSFRLSPGHFVVVTSDSLTLESTRPVFSPILEADLPTLNNGGDLVALHSKADRVVDSVRYDPDWGGNSGVSLERRGLFDRSVDSASWGSSIDAGGGTPGWANSILPAEHDLRLDRATFHPDRAIVLLQITNIGTTPASGGEVRIYFDIDRDAVPDEDELERVHSLPLIQPENSIEIECPWERELLPEGEQALADVWVDGEERREDNLLPFSPHALLGSSGAIINEFQPNPSGSEPEWVELFNPLELPINLDGWSVADGASSVHLKANVILRGGAYGVITTDTSLLRSAHRLPAGSVLVEAKLPSLNNGGDELTLRNAEGEVVDSLSYGVDWPTTGKGSLERRHPDLPSVNPAAWTLSIDPEGGTPGRANSTILPEKNLTLDSAWFDREEGWLSVLLQNGGVEPLGGGSLVLRLDSVELDRLPLGRLNFNESIILDYQPTIELTDIPLTLIITLEVEGDERSEDDTAYVLLQRRPAETGLIITELMVDPLPTPEGPGAEYVEVYNLGDRPVPLTGWGIEDGSGRKAGSGRSEFPASAVLPGRFGVIASDSSLFTLFPELGDSGSVLIVDQDLGLNNSDDRVLLRNPSGAVVDSLSYSSDWHSPERIDTRGISLERIDFDRSASDPSAWASSVDPRGGTPAAENSRRLPPAEGEGLVELSSETLSPDGDGYEDFLRIAWHLPFTPATLRISVLDPGGRTLAHPVDNLPSGPQGDIIWDGRDDQGGLLPIGPVILRVEAVESRTGRRVVDRRVIVIAGKL